MVTLYVMSMERFSGKTAICLGLARRLASDGHSVGYMKPIAIAIKRAEAVDVDASLIKRSLGLAEPMGVLSPVSIDGQALDRIFSEKAGDMRARVSDAFRIASSGKDIMVIEGPNGLSEGAMVGLDNGALVEMLDGRCLLVVRCCSEVLADDILAVKGVLGNRLLGTVLNAVPRGMVEFVTDSLAPFLSRRGVKVYAVLPEDRMLMAVTVGELIDRLGGRVITGQDRMDELVENVMVGAMSVENALNYFRRRANKVVITGGDRADIQLAALETSTRCIVLTGNLYPHPLILGRAEEQGVPMVLVEQDTLAAVELVEQVFCEVRFHQEKKLKRFFGMLATNFNYDEFKADLGV